MSPRRAGSQRPTASSTIASRPVTPPQSAPPAQKQARKVRFEQEKTELHGETSAATKRTQQKESAKQPSKTDATVVSSQKDKGTKTGKHPTTDKKGTETQPTSAAATSAEELLVATPKLDALVEVTKQAVRNLNKRETGVKIKEPPLKPKKAKHPLPAKGRSTYAGKGKATAPVKKPPEVVKVSLQDVLGSILPVQEQRVTSSPRPTPTTVKPKTVPGILRYSGSNVSGSRS